MVIRPKKMLYEASRINKWWLSKPSIKEHHMHLIIETKPVESVTEEVQRLKGEMSRVLKREYPELKELFGEDSFWTEEYFAEIVRIVDEEFMRRYIMEQRRSYP